MHRIKYLACIAIFISGAIIHTVRADTVGIVPGLYEVKAETFLPNLREHLRHTVTSRTQCLVNPDAFALFPILGEVSFTGCDLAVSNSGKGRFSLLCENISAASGDALFTIGSNGFSAVLNIKMGGKNMKFSQQITAVRIGECEPTQ